jgi:hypothetical protein
MIDKPIKQHAKLQVGLGSIMGMAPSIALLV